MIRYLKDRGFRPGMGLMDLYSTINAGRPGLYGASDGNGTVGSHVAAMQGAAAARARALLALAAAPETPSQKLAARGQLPSGAMYWATDSRGNRVAVDAQGRAVGQNGKPTTISSPSPDMSGVFKAPPLGPTPALVQQYNQSRTRGDTNVNHTQTFNITGGDPTATLAAARLSASRGQVDLLRNIQGSEQ